MSQEGEGPNSDDKEWLKKLRINHHLFFISEFLKNVQNFDKMLPERNFERQLETLNAL